MMDEEDEWAATKARHERELATVRFEREMMEERAKLEAVRQGEARRKEEEARKRAERAAAEAAAAERARREAEEARKRRAAALASENKALATPRHTDSLPTVANQEDYVSMATHAARRLGEMAKGLHPALVLGLPQYSVLVRKRRRLLCTAPGPNLSCLMGLRAWRRAFPRL